MVSTNNDSDVFRREMEMLQKLMAEESRRLAAVHRDVWVLPGHGEMYRVEEAMANGAWPQLDD